jgi:hypothetical protein
MYNHDIDRTPTDMKFNGFYRGTVIDVNDPLEAGRVKIRVFSVYDDVKDSVIPWAEYADPFFTNGMFVPDVGDKIWVFFDNGDHMHPIYFAGSQGKPIFDGFTHKKGANDGGSTTYPKNRTIKTKIGHLIEIDDSNGGRINIRHTCGTRLTMLANGDVEMIVKKDLIQKITGNVITEVGGNVTETVGGHRRDSVSGNTIMTASNIYLN